MSKISEAIQRDGFIDIQYEPFVKLDIKKFRKNPIIKKGDKDAKHISKNWGLLPKMGRDFVLV